ncbi:MAG: MAE_28990/MAE_18760 family HEPN-like nuclease [Candidatus Thiodiazotropha endolucinida]|nr:MAE_28990/MAE_18760 family HEPN-like nuclease [Candidatus Thiodiazotropha taylori]MCG8097369.1 MAE_28990/MAE_18760 family HEPN-like nuclease [Candidatus Thiodiazotropha endolucinida]MCW4267815.1 MAE_28990/MAE_18760 family HEPN-like nuclease [Candidatus Thiodiazotropha endolucinida]
MARYTTAYSAFVARLNEVETLRRYAAGEERTNPVGRRNEINALCRGAVVLLSGHLEAYIKKLGETALDSMTAKNVPRTNISQRLYYHISKDLLNEIQDTADPEKIAGKVFSFLDSDLEYWSKTGPFPKVIPTERFNKGFANPAFTKIKKYFNRFGYTDYQDDLAKRLQANYLPTVNMVDHLVDTRNKIAHGDPAASETPAEVKTMISITQNFCGSTDAVFATWWKTNFCAIR